MNKRDDLSAAIEAHRKGQPCPLDDALILATKIAVGKNINKVKAVPAILILDAQGEYWIEVILGDGHSSSFKIEAKLPGLES